MGPSSGDSGQFPVPEMEDIGVLSWHVQETYYFSKEILPEIKTQCSTLPYR